MEQRKCQRWQLALLLGPMLVAQAAVAPLALAAQARAIAGATASTTSRSSKINRYGCNGLFATAELPRPSRQTSGAFPSESAIGMGWGWVWGGVNEVEFFCGGVRDGDKRAKRWVGAGGGGLGVELCSTFQSWWRLHYLK